MHVVLTRRADPLEVPDGINVFVFALADELMRRGHEVSVVSGAASDGQAVSRFYRLERSPRIVSLSGRRSLTPPRAAWTWSTRGRRAIARLAPDFLIVNGVVPVRFPALTCAVSHDLEQREGALGTRGRTLYKRVSYRRADRVVATCTELRLALAEELRIPPDRIGVIPTCIPVESYTPRPLSERRPAVLHMGTADYKNPAATIAAFATLRHPDARLYVTGPDAPALRPVLDGLPAEVRDRVELTGYVSEQELRELLATVRCLSVPSTYWSPVASPTVLEGLASGTPVVGSHSISEDLLQEGVNGYRRSPSDAAGLAAAMDELLDDDARWEALAAGALRTSREFGSARVADEYLRLAGAGETAPAVSPAGPREASRS